jgi:predicted alpha/beta hydrolase family esterase
LCPAGFVFNQEMARVLINHGWTNTRQVGHWQRLLASALRVDGHQVLYPQYPNTQKPVFDEWQELLAAELELLNEAGAGETVVICHSLGCVNFLIAAKRGLITTPIDRVLLVAPADPRTLGEIPEFRFEVAESKDALNRIAKSVTLVGSDKDPWTPSGVQKTFGEPLGLEAVILPGAGHLASADGFGPWAGVVNWVNAPTADLTAR